MQVVKDGTTGEVLYREQHCPLVEVMGGNAQNVAFTSPQAAFKHVIDQLAEWHVSKPWRRANSLWMPVFWAKVDCTHIGHIGMVRYVTASHEFEFSFFNTGREDHAVFHDWLKQGRVGAWQDEVLFRMNRLGEEAVAGRNLIQVSAADVDRAIEILARRAVRH